MFLSKKHFAKKRRTDEYFRYRDSLTGMMNLTFAFKEYEKLKGLSDMGAVMVNIPGCDELPYYKATEYIKNASGLISRICTEDFARLDDGVFLAFSENFKRLEERLTFFLRDFTEGDRMYAVASDALDENESFEQFISRIKRHTGAVAVGNMMQML